MSSTQRSERKLRSLWAARLRDALQASGLTANALARASGLTQPTVANFLNSESKDLNLTSAERLAALVQLDLVKVNDHESENR